MRAGELAKALTERLSSVSDCADFEAKCLLEHFCGLTLSDIYLDKEVEDVSDEALEAAVRQRLAHRPLQYILGKWEFMGNPFIVNENVLIPRPETELLVESLLDSIQQSSVVYDLCSGSGCVAISVAKLTGAKVYAVEKYPQALEVLQKNIVLNGAETVEVLQWDITQAPGADWKKADCILSNPPYIENAVVKTLQAEVLQEPYAALVGGDDGLDFYRAIAENFTDLLKPGGYLALEIGEGQEAAVKEIFCDLHHVRTRRDYNNIARIVIFGKEQ
ncbi:MAG: peptide chain release factor N(5)-glutamine methyltransferase [Ruminococcaceae bacterium]|nr:peptide chain release factor N(5)-glutamine methyltransferase [Oscillospiraceae bacterium]